MIVDSGACFSFIDRTVVEQHRVSTHRLEKPKEFSNADGSRFGKKPVGEYCTLTFQVDDKVTTEQFYVAELGPKDKFLLGRPWLICHNPVINWANGTVFL
ncbi:hypothetical protein BDR06DRAFT_900473, partial [Suillus hirtellus]